MANKEITLKDLILLIKEYFFEVLRKWWVVLLFVIPITLYFVRKTYITPSTYSAQTKFLVEGNEGGVSGLGGILGSLGIGGRGGDKSNPFKIVEVALSKAMTHKILFDKSECSDEYIGNLLLDKYDLPNTWAQSNEEYRGFKFTTDDDFQFTDLDRKVFLRLYRFIFGTELRRDLALMTLNFNKESGVFKYNVKTEHECLSLSLINSSYDNLRYIFEEELLADKIKTLKVLEAKKDSIKSLIDSKGLQYANQKDRSRNRFSAMLEYESNKLLLEIEGMTSAYTEILRSFEMTDISFRDSRPTFMMIDKPYPPLGRVSESLILNIVLGFLLGFFLATVCIVGNKFIRDIINESNS
jgi:hypothetical protein